MIPVDLFSGSGALLKVLYFFFQLKEKSSK